MLPGAASRYNKSLSPEREEREADVLSYRLTGKCKITDESATFAGCNNEDFRLLGCDVGSLEEAK